MGAKPKKGTRQNALAVLKVKSMNLDDFIKSTAPRSRGKLKNYIYEIEAMVDAGYSLTQMQAFFKSNGVCVSAQAIGYQRRVVLPRLKALRAEVSV